MINTLLGKIFGTKNEREIKRVQPRVAAINALESEMKKLTDEQLRAKTAEFRARVRERLSSIADEPEADPDLQDPDIDRQKEIETQRAAVLKGVLEELLEEAFAVVREAGRRVLDMRHFDVQLIGGMVLHEGKIAEMKTGEGKTLVATLPVYLNALSGRGVHVVTVNDYLAKRDSEWMGKLYSFLGLTVIGMPAGFFGRFRISPVRGFVNMILTFVMALVGAWIAAIVVEKLAPTFQSKGNTTQALKLVVYAMTPVWVAGVLHLVPVLGVLTILAALYSIYLFYLGLPVVMSTPTAQVIPYMVVSAVVVIVVSLVLGAVTTAMAGIGAMSSF